MQYFDFTVAPGKVAPISCQGRRFYYSAGSAAGLDSTIKVRFGTSGQSLLLKPGQGVRAPEGTAISDTAYIENWAGQATIIGTVFIGEDEIIDNRSTGSVEMVDGGKARTYAGIAYMGTMYQAGLAGQFAHVELFNPAASGKNIVIEQVGMTADNSASGFSIGYHNAQLANAGGFGKSKKAGGADATMQMFAGQYGAVQGTSLGGIDTQIKNFKFTEPVIVPPGWGFVVANVTYGGNLSATIEFHLDPV